MKTNLLLLAALLTAPLFATAQTTILFTTDSIARTETVSPRVCKTVNRITSDLHVYVGFNNLGGTLPAGYDFRPIGSRFVALSWQHRIPLSVNGPTKLRLITGPEVAWNNFMFNGRTILTEQANELQLVQADRDLRKSKLTMAQLNLPLLVNVAFRSGLSLSVGAYAGFRLDSYTKVKPEGSAAVRVHDDYQLNSVRWGLTSELGFRGRGRLFFRYEPDSPFQVGQGPGSSLWAAGIKL